uniref:Uncharacterized protein n=1 Tax=Anguilla anguilla TaxID=7936 RepID=A0A0E9V4Q0_ANGAN
MNTGMEFGVTTQWCHFLPGKGYFPSHNIQYVYNNHTGFEGIRFPNTVLTVMGLEQCADLS